MLPEMVVVKIPYESSLAPKQTVDGFICIHPMAGKKISRFWMDFLIFLNKKWDDKLDGYTPYIGIKRDFWMGLDS